MHDGPTPHLTWRELTTRRGTQGVDLPHLTDALRRPLTRVAEVVEVLRAEYGRPVRVTCGLRHGQTKSQHGHGQAVDIQIDGVTPLEAMQTLHDLAVAGRLPHALRQVIAEARGTGIDEPMGKGSNRWLHIAVLGLDGEEYRKAHPSGLWWMSLDGESYTPRSM